MQSTKLANFSNNLPRQTGTQSNAYSNKGTTRHGLYFEGGSDTEILACDADYAGDVETRKSTTGYILKLGPSTIVSQRGGSQRQKIVAPSTTEAEYVAACQAVKELI